MRNDRLLAKGVRHFWCSCSKLLSTALSTCWKKRCGNVEKKKFPQIAAASFSDLLTLSAGALVCCLRRARSASRSKPNPKAVPGRGRSAEAVDESETGSPNFFGPAHARDFRLLEPGQVGEIAGALLEKEKCANCGRG